MNEYTLAARIGLRSALQLRRSLSIPRESVVNIYDIATAIGIDVRFLDSPSLEGMFCREPGPIIFLPSLKHRPSGRVCFSCAHEVGHQQLNHGTRVDEYTESAHSEPRPIEEVTADVFAAQLLMPRPAVLSAFDRRKLHPENASPIQLFTISRELGVGYETLLMHMDVALGVLPRSVADQKRKTSPKSIRMEVLGEDKGNSLTIADVQWSDVPIDLEAGDNLALPIEIGSIPAHLAFEKCRDGFHIVRAVRPGVGNLAFAGRKIAVRVSRKDYIGPLKNRFLDDPECE